MTPLAAIWLGGYAIAADVAGTIQAWEMRRVATADDLLSRMGGSP